jgi:hypothetical protein
LLRLGLKATRNLSSVEVHNRSYAAKIKIAASVF